MLGMTVVVDVPVIVLTVLLCTIWAVIGYVACHTTHKQRGIEIDEFITPSLDPVGAGPKLGA
jgi:hypothetical protein